MPSEKVCSVQRVQDSVFIVSFKGLTMQMCGHSLASFSKLLVTGAQKHRELFDVVDESKNDIESLLYTIEQNIQPQ